MDMGEYGADAAQLRLLHLVSPSMPIGGFTYSQGLEWAVEAGWVADRSGLSRWLEGLLETTQTRVDVPLLARLYRAWQADDVTAARRWSLQLLAWRETYELRLEEGNRGRALTSLLISLEVDGGRRWQDTLKLCQAGGFALAAVRWGIPLREAVLGYLWSWLENQVIAAVKIIPLGQTDGQRVLHDLLDRLVASAECGLNLQDNELGASSPAMTIASSLHETQYTRLFRS